MSRATKTISICDSPFERLSSVAANEPVPAAISWTMGVCEPKAGLVTRRVATSQGFVSFFAHSSSLK